MNRIELEQRLVDHASSIILLCKKCKFDEFTYHLSTQLVRSSSSAALNYGEAESAESKKDFLHKISIVLKELRETGINLRIIVSTSVCNDPDLLQSMIDENRSLTAIFQKSVATVNGKMI